MVKVFIKGAGLRGYICGASFQPMVQEVLVPVGDLKQVGKGAKGGVPDLSKALQRVRQQVMVPVFFVVLEDGRLGITQAADIVPLVSDEEMEELKAAAVPEEALEESRRIREETERRAVDPQQPVSEEVPVIEEAVEDDGQEVAPAE